MRDRDAASPARLTRDDARWLGLAVAVGTAVAVAYLLTHPYPAYGAGLYLTMVERVLDSGYRLPETVPHYTARGVPFAYPPLAFYATAAVLDHTTVAPVTLTRYVPASLTVLYLVPYYFLARTLLGGRREAGFATVLLAVTPSVFRWHLSAGGLVRALAFLFVLTGAYVGVRLFRSGDRRWLAPATLLFGLTVLTHPVYTVFFGLTYLLFYLAFDRSVAGVVAGAVVALGGLALASPWWVSVVRAHGVGVFSAAAGTHTGLFGQTRRLLDQFVYPLVTAHPVPVFFLLSFAGTFYFLGRRRFLLPAWLLTGAFLVGKDRFQFVAGSMMTAVVLLAATRKLSRAHLPATTRRSAVRVVVAVAVVAGGGLAVVTVVAPNHGVTSQPQFVDRSDEAAMTWVQGHTDRSAAFVVLGDAAEWFPFFTDRTLLVGPWGVEWTTPADYERQRSLYRTLSTCHTERCVTARLREADVRPDYLYVPKGPHTVQGAQRQNTATLWETLERSNRYRVAYENRQVGILRVVGSGDGPSLSSGASASVATSSRHWRAAAATEPTM